MPSLARPMPKPLKVPSLGRSVQKPQVPSLARSVPKPLKMGQAQACERAGGVGEAVHPSRWGPSLFRLSLPTSYSPGCEK